MKNIINTENGKVYAPGLKSRGQWQNARVAVGVQNGKISESELSSLKNLRASNRESLADAKASDGYVNLQERKDLHEAMNLTSEVIFNYKHG